MNFVHSITVITKIDYGDIVISHTNHYHQEDHHCNRRDGVAVR